jgi:hypothetical protein
MERYLALAPAAVDADRIRADCHLQRAIDAARRGAEAEVAVEVTTALRHDPGLFIPPEGRTPRELVRGNLTEILARARAPSTLCALAHLCDRGLGDRTTARALYRAYLRIAADAPNRSEVRDRLARIGPGGAVRLLARRAARRLAAAFEARQTASGTKLEGRAR